MSLLDLDEAEVEELLRVILARHGHDFRHYARASLLRQVDRFARKLQVQSVAELTRRLAHDRAIGARLVDGLTVHVTEMFRDPPFFAVLRREVLPVLATWPRIKVWVAGCATGEEAWSMALLLDEEGLLERSLVYATDISEGALAVAQKGVYPLDQLATFAENHRASGSARALTESFHLSDGHAVIERRLRDHVVFAEHSLATDGVFSEVHLVTCRNVLIYFDRELQDRAVGLFRDALPHGGFLGLGTRESLAQTGHAGAFEPVDRLHRVYRRVEWTG